MPQQAQSATPMSARRKTLLIFLGAVLLVVLLIFKGLVMMFGALFHHGPKYAFDVTGEWSGRASASENISLDLSLDGEGKLHGAVVPCRAHNRYFGMTRPQLDIFTDRSSWNGQNLHLESLKGAQHAEVDAGVQGARLYGSYSWYESPERSVAHTVTFTRGGGLCN